MNRKMIVINGIKHFPIMGDKRNGYTTTYIPYWLVVMAYKHYKCDQSIERLADRGGFGREEFIELLRQEWPE